MEIMPAPPAHRGEPRACRPGPAPGALSIALVLDPKPCVSEKNGWTVRMKEFAAGSKAKTVQLADFKWLVCPLDAQLEKLPPSSDVCGGRGQTGAVEAPAPSICWHGGSGQPSPGRAEGSTTGGTALHSAPRLVTRASLCSRPSKGMSTAHGGGEGGCLPRKMRSEGGSQLQQARLRGPPEAALGTSGREGIVVPAWLPLPFPTSAPLH